VTEQPINKSGKGGIKFFEKVLRNHFIVFLYYFNCHTHFEHQCVFWRIVKEKGTLFKISNVKNQRTNVAI
jgi:hypothetical protein